jgi:hypothetical protein
MCADSNSLRNLTQERGGPAHANQGWRRRWRIFLRPKAAQEFKSKVVPLVFWILIDALSVNLSDDRFEFASNCFDAGTVGNLRLCMLHG